MGPTSPSKVEEPAVDIDFVRMPKKFKRDLHRAIDAEASKLARRARTTARQVIKKTSYSKLHGKEPEELAAELIAQIVLSWVKPVRPIASPKVDCLEIDEPGKLTKKTIDWLKRPLPSCSGAVSR